MGDYMATNVPLHQSLESLQSEAEELSGSICLWISIITLSHHKDENLSDLTPAVKYMPSGKGELKQESEPVYASLWKFF